MRRYPNVDEVMVAHERLIERFGGSHGLRDRAALESARARPMSGYYPDVIAEAAALMESLSQNHPFDPEAYEFLIGLYESGAFRFDRLEPWLREHATTG